MNARREQGASTLPLDSDAMSQPALAPPVTDASSPQIPQISRWAAVSLFLGLASLLLLFLAGIPAIWIGLNALRAVNASDGRLRDRRLAVAGAALGGLGCLAAIIGFVVLVFVSV